MTVSIDLGHDHRASFFGWHPDRDLNPQFADRPDIELAGVTIRHSAPDGTECSSAAMFDVPGVELLAPGQARWQVGSIEPLTLTPSVLCVRCGDHGHITAGCWIPC